MNSFSNAISLISLSLLNALITNEIKEKSVLGQFNMHHWVYYTF